VLTFDDGPASGTTGARARCAQARMRTCIVLLAGAQRTLLSGTCAARGQARVIPSPITHSRTPLLDRMPVVAAAAEIDRGFGRRRRCALRPFGPDARAHRSSAFPASPRPRPCSTGWSGAAIVVFGADLWASDWDPICRHNSSFILSLRRVEANRGGIVLFHDTKKQTAAMLPSFLRLLKKGGYRIVHVVSRKSLMGCVACRRGAVRVSCRSSHRPDSLHPTEAIKEPLNCLPPTVWVNQQMTHIWARAYLGVGPEPG